MLKVNNVDEERDAYSIATFCARHGICRATFYNLRKLGQAPRIMRAGGRVMISREAAGDWRRERELPSDK